MRSAVIEPGGRRNMSFNRLSDRFPCQWSLGSTLHYSPELHGASQGVVKISRDVGPQMWHAIFDASAWIGAKRGRYGIGKLSELNVEYAAPVMGSGSRRGFCVSRQHIAEHFGDLCFELAKRAGVSHDM